MNRRLTQSSQLMLLVLILVHSASATAQFGLTPTDGVTLPENSITSRDDPLSIELNPAGIGLQDGFEADGAFAVLDDDVLVGGGLFFGFGGLGPLGLGGAVQYVENPDFGGAFTKFSFATALRPLRTFSLGFTFNFFDSDLDESVDNFSSWDVGFIWRPANWLGLAATIRDFNTPRLGAVPLEPRYTMGSSFRFDPEGRYLFEFDGIYEGIEDNWYLRTRLSLEPVNGFTFFGELQSDPVDDFGLARLNTGLNFSLGRASVGVAMLTELGESVRGASMRVRLVSRPLRSALEPTGFMAGLTLSGGLPERGMNNFIFGRTNSFLDLLVHLDELAHDHRIDGLVLRIEDLSLGLGQLWELRQALLRFGEAGKTVVVYLSTADFGDLYIATVADAIYMAPGVPFFPAGLSTRLTYLGDLFRNIGVEPEFVRIGEYKSAAEAFVEGAPSEQTLEAINAYVDDVYNAMVATIAASREVTVDEVQTLIDTTPHTPDAAMAAGFIDGICFQDELEETLSEHFSRTIQIAGGYSSNFWRNFRWTSPPAIAVVYVDGSIIAGSGGSAPLVGQTSGHRTLIRTLDNVSRTRNVRAIVLRVASPGGSAWASEEIWRAVQQADERVPVVVSMGNTAASGGYYVAAGGREIFATPLTLTGSIGIFSGHFAARELFSWAGINRVPIARGSASTLFSFDEPWTDEQRDAAFRHISMMYDTFLTRVADNRGVTPDDIDPIARGRIWSGQRALENGLVDRLGGLSDAIARARELGGLDPDDDYQLLQLPEQSIFSSLGLLSMLRVGADADDEALEAYQAIEEPAELDALQLMLEAFGITPVLALPLLYDDGEPLMRLEFEVMGLE